MNIDFLLGEKVVLGGEEFTVKEVDSTKGYFTLNDGTKFNVMIPATGRPVSDSMVFDSKVKEKLEGVVKEYKRTDIKAVFGRAAGCGCRTGKTATGPVAKLDFDVAFRKEVDAVNSCFHKDCKVLRKGGYTVNDIYHVWFPKIARIADGNIELQNEKDTWINYFDPTGEYLYETNVDPDEVEKRKDYAGLDRITFAKFGGDQYVFVGVYRRVDNQDKTVRKFRRIASEFDLKNIDKRLGEEPEPEHQAEHQKAA